jgi:hypothetical protein
MLDGWKAASGEEDSIRGSETKPFFAGKWRVSSGEWRANPGKGKVYAGAGELAIGVLAGKTGQYRSWEKLQVGLFGGLVRQV